MLYQYLQFNIDASLYLCLLNIALIDPLINITHMVLINPIPTNNKTLLADAIVSLHRYIFNNNVKERNILLNISKTQM